MFSNTDKVTFMESSDANFNLRQKSVFDEVDKLERSRPSHRYSHEQFSESQHSKSKVKVGRSKDLKAQFKGYESIFKTPEGPPPKKQWLKKMPDYQVNPHRWTRYSLEDVSDRDMSEQSNTAAAMDFLRNQGSQISISDNKSPTIKIAPKFTKVSSKTDIILRTGEVKTKSQHPLFSGSKREMPEYVVGQKQKKIKSEKRKPAEAADKSVKLSHLFDDDE